MQVWGLTDVGCTRAQNQDACLIEKLDKHTLLCVVCDGMGGAKSGNIASTPGCGCVCSAGEADLDRRVRPGKCG